MSCSLGNSSCRGGTLIYGYTWRADWLPLDHSVRCAHVAARSCHIGVDILTPLHSLQTQKTVISKIQQGSHTRLARMCDVWL